MLLFLSIVKLICEIALMALFGQWVLGLLAGAKRDTNLFYQLLQQVGRPFVVAARFITPRSIVLDRHVPLVAFLVLAFAWIVVTALRIQHCLRIGVELCK
ncbi:MAG TPA: hypothetical protein VLG41_06445 [Hydrogenophaga sp.]|uniref:hypothetical protein n=1 Tax=Hydrogenophaga sp. TaxID=1904254 RepID=UPI002D0C0C09|nr:hypothetical protein [Hydrogenophaga sp.]HSX92538.1 hypothetical protein [Hydrogenophaga sp.]